MSLEREIVMAVKRKNQDGEYQDFDLKTGEFLPSGLGQIEHQTAVTSLGRVIDHDEAIRPEVVDETGVALTSEDENKIKELIKQSISVENLIETFNDNSHETLLKLLALQDNKHPLKKGGIGIAYRTDALIMHCKMEFSAEENVVFDAILGTMSTYPENKSYKIAPGDFNSIAKYGNDKTIYGVFKRGSEKLKQRHLVFDELGPKGEDDIIIPWFNILHYHNADDVSNAYIEFSPSEFFKDLALCSQIVHGAYGALEVTTQLRGKYTIAIYWYLENRKNFKAYPSAQPGYFEMSIEEMKHQFNIPESYGKTDIERRVLNPAYESINNCNECDFTFEYESKKADGKLAGYIFKITNKNYIDAKADEVIEIEVDPFEEQIKMFMSLSGVPFSDDEINQIYKCAKKNNRDAAFMMQAASVLKTRIDNKKMETIDNPLGYLMAIIIRGTLADSAKIEKDYNNAKNTFNNYSQRDNRDFYDELEKSILRKN